MNLPTSLASIARIVWPDSSAPRGAPDSVADDDVAIVTAFFDIGRSEWLGDDNRASIFRRSVDDYFANFARLAKLKNRMIVFTEPRLATRALELRRANGLERHTTIIAIPDLFESDLVASVKAEVARRMSEIFHRWVVSPTCPEYREPRYVVVNALKAAFVCTAIDLGVVSDPQVAWVDFGYCRDDLRFDPAEPWRFDAGDKINLFCITPLDDIPIYKVIRYGTVYFHGCHIVGPTSAWLPFAVEISFCFEALLACDLVDDDQTLLLMAWRRNPDAYRIHAVDASDLFVLFQKFRAGIPINPVHARPGRPLRSEPSWREELRIAQKRTGRWLENWFKRTIRRPLRAVWHLTSSAGEPSAVANTGRSSRSDARPHSGRNSS